MPMADGWVIIAPPDHLAVALLAIVLLIVLGIIGCIRAPAPQLRSQGASSFNSMLPRFADRRSYF
jgi:hypothetical protein